MSTHQARLLELWEGEPGLKGFFGTVDHKKIGIRYIVTAFVFLVLRRHRGADHAPAAGGAESDAADSGAIQPAVLDAWHDDDLSVCVADSLRIFQLSVAVAARQPRHGVSAPQCAELLDLPGGGTLPVRRVSDRPGPNDGWFNYVPYASRDYNPGLNEDFYSLGMVLLGISTTVGAANFIVTAIRTRAPGMSINRVPILMWGTLTASVANLLVVPAVSLAFLLLWLDRQFGTHFFDPRQAGQPLLWQHLFWMFAHPWVYAIVLPAMGMVSEALPVFCRRPLVGYSLVALSTVATMILGFGVWVHHMFATDCPDSACRSSPAPRLSSCCPRRWPCLPGSPPSGSAGR